MDQSMDRFGTGYTFPRTLRGCGRGVEQNQGRVVLESLIIIIPIFSELIF